MHHEPSTANASPNRQAPAPPTWKMALLNFIGLYPLILFVPKGFDALVGTTPLWLSTLVTLSLIIIMTWLVTPFLTRVFSNWLR